MTETLNFKPLSNMVVLEIIKKERSKGKIIIPETAKVPVIEGEVRAISEEKTAEGDSMIRNVKIGDRVIFNINAGQIVEIDEEQFLILRETDIFGILTKPSAKPLKSDLTLVN